VAIIIIIIIYSYSKYIYKKKKKHIPILTDISPFFRVTNKNIIKTPNKRKTCIKAD